MDTTINAKYNALVSGRKDAARDMTRATDMLAAAADSLANGGLGLADVYRAIHELREIAADLNG